MLGLFEFHGQNLGSKHFWFMNPERFTRWHPRNDISVLAIGENFHQLCITNENNYLQRSELVETMHTSTKRTSPALNSHGEATIDTPANPMLNTKGLIIRDKTEPRTESNVPVCIGARGKSSATSTTKYDESTVP